MPNDADDAHVLGPGFQWRLRSVLDRVQPRFAMPRYAVSQARLFRPLRITAVALALALAGLVALSAFAATGSPNPSVWRARIVTTLQSSPATTPTAESREGGFPGAAVPRHAATPRPEPSESPEAGSGGREREP